MTINHSNIIYVSDISQIGGVETWAYELAKKYHDLDIAVVYKTGDVNQIKRLLEYVPVYKFTGEKIQCDVAVINYDTTIVPHIDAKIGIYSAVHADYENPAYHCKYPTHPNVKEYICITKHIMESWGRITGNKNLRLCYNPLIVEKAKRPLVLLSATRLSKEKGKNRMQMLATALDDAGVEYVWLVFTNETDAIKSPNVVFLPPKLDIGRWFEVADYIIQLSDTEACSYTIAEALFRNKPIITTPLPYLKEIGVEDGKNAYIMEFDCSNIDDIVKNVTNVPKFNFKKWEDDYGDIFTKKKAKKLDGNVKVLVKKKYDDIQLGKIIRPRSIIEMTRKRALFLAGLGLVEIKEEK